MKHFTLFLFVSVTAVGRHVSATPKWYDSDSPVTVRVGEVNFSVSLGLCLIDKLHMTCDMYTTATNASDDAIWIILPGIDSPNESLELRGASIEWRPSASPMVGHLDGQDSGPADFFIFRIAGHSKVEMRTPLRDPYEGPDRCTTKIRIDLRIARDIDFSRAAAFRPPIGFGMSNEAGPRLDWYAWPEGVVTGQPSTVDGVPSTRHIEFVPLTIILVGAESVSLEMPRCLYRRMK